MKKKNEAQMEMKYEKEIPERYKEVFEVDWRGGENCKIPYEYRLELHKLWLEYNHMECRKMIIKPEDEIVLGFPKD